MAKATKPLGGTAKDKYLRDLVAATPGLGAEAARQLVDTATREIAQVRVRLPLPERPAQQPVKEKRASAPQALGSDPVPPPAPVPTSMPTQADPEPAVPAFDPFAFSATVVLKRKGKAELQRLLASVREPAQLKLIAEKQHLGIAPQAATLDELRAEIVKAAEVRIADRRAAAS